MFPLPFKWLNKPPSETGQDQNSSSLGPTQSLLTLTCPPHGVWFLCLIFWLLNNLHITGWIPSSKAHTCCHTFTLTPTTNYKQTALLVVFPLLWPHLWRHNVKQRVPEPMVLSINNARSMSLLSFLFFFPKGVGWIQSSDTPAGPIRLISHTSRFSSSHSIPFISTSLIVLLHSVFPLLLHFHFSFGSVTSALSILEILILFSFPFLFISHYPYSHCRFMFSYASTPSVPSPV